jgi:hypothetical protein
MGCWGRAGATLLSVTMRLLMTVLMVVWWDRPCCRWWLCDWIHDDWKHEDGWWLMIDDAWRELKIVMMDDWWLIIDDWWLMIDDSWLTIDGLMGWWWLMMRVMVAIDDWWLMIDPSIINQSSSIIDGLMVINDERDGDWWLIIDDWWLMNGQGTTIQSHHQRRFPSSCRRFAATSWSPAEV